MVKDYIIKELPSEKGNSYTETKFSIKLNENDELLVQTAIITALMEASKDWKEFEKLHKKQQKSKNNKPIPKELTDFDHILKGILQVPKEETKK